MANKQANEGPGRSGRGYAQPQSSRSINWVIFSRNPRRNRLIPPLASILDDVAARIWEERRGDCQRKTSAASVSNKEHADYLIIANISFAEPEAEDAIRHTLTQRGVPFEIRYGSIADAVAVEKSHATESIRILKELASEKRFWIDPVRDTLHTGEGFLDGEMMDFHFGSKAPGAPGAPRR